MINILTCPSIIHNCPLLYIILFSYLDVLLYSFFQYIVQYTHYFIGTVLTVHKVITFPHSPYPCSLLYSLLFPLFQSSAFLSFYFFHQFPLCFPFLLSFIIYTDHFHDHDLSTVISSIMLCNTLIHHSSLHLLFPLLFSGILIT